MLKDYLIACPYNRETDSQKEVTEEIFLRDYFVLPKVYKSIDEKFDIILKDRTTKLPISIFLHGYAGTGKTTYIRQYSKKIKDYHNVIFFDLTNTFGTRHKNNKERVSPIFDDFFQNLANRIFYNYKNPFILLLREVYEKRLLLQTAFTNYFFKLLANIYNSKIGVDQDDKFSKMTNSLPFQDLLLLVLLFYYKNPSFFLSFFIENFNLELPLLIVFDNIDHIDIESRNYEFPKLIEETYHNYSEIISTEYKLKQKPISFIFCLRDANCAIINRQLSENTGRKEIQFLPMNEQKDIFLKRLELANHGMNVLEKNQKIKFLSFVFDDFYTKKSFLPLFNYNFRKFSEFISEIATEYHEVIESVSGELIKNKRFIHGARGIESFYIIKHLLGRDFLKKNLFLENSKLIGAIHSEFINPTRILLTNLHNLSRFTMDKLQVSIHVNPIGLYELFSVFNQIFTDRIDLFFEIITNLFLFHKENWCHLLTITNKSIFSNTDFKKEKLLLKKIIDTKNYDLINTLDNIKVQLNPAGFIYLRDIIRHFEFFSIRAQNKKPLFSAISVSQKQYFAIEELEFLPIIRSTFKIVKACIDSLNNFLKSDKIKNFEDSNHCFRLWSLEDDFKEDFYASQYGRLYIVQIIDSHIRYLDTYRIYILHNNELLDQIKFDDKIKKINLFIINFINKYIELLKNTNTKNPRAKELTLLFRKNINKIKTKKYLDIETLVNEGRQNEK